MEKRSARYPHPHCILIARRTHPSRQNVKGEILRVLESPGYGHGALSVWSTMTDAFPIRCQP
jgi:hypothetical protein